LSALAEKGLDIPLIGLAKRYETIILPFPRSDLGKLQRSGSSLASPKIAKTSQFEIIRLPANSDALKLLQRIRDESHRFAVSYHSSLKGKRQTASILDNIPGIGPATRKKLIKHFGSARAATHANQTELSLAVGEAKAGRITDSLGRQ
jgi:excinuclease ABC subunit C